MARMRSILLPIIQILLAVLLTTAILLQQRGTGLGSAFGGEGNVFRTKRGVEKSLFYATIGLTVLFFASAILNVALA
jgi:preprotein translocase subunit SecG